jgi:hypothetical protein
MKKYQRPKISQKKMVFNFFTRNARWNFGSMFETSILYACSSSDPDCSRTCFLGGTKINLSNKSKKPIEQFVPGDIILSYDLKNNRIVYNKVLELLIHKNSNGYYLINKKIKVTEEHLFWNTVEWIRTKDLKKNDKLFGLQNEIISIKEIKKINSTNIVYNLHLANYPHNYFAEGCLVHNYK